MGIHDDPYSSVRVRRGDRDMAAAVFGHRLWRLTSGPKLASESHQASRGDNRTLTTSSARVGSLAGKPARNTVCHPTAAEPAVANVVVAIATVAEMGSAVARIAGASPGTASLLALARERTRPALGGERSTE
jgi:hypothetical protein